MVKPLRPVELIAREMMDTAERHRLFLRAVQAVEPPSEERQLKIKSLERKATELEEMALRWHAGGA